MTKPQKRTPGALGAAGSRNMRIDADVWAELGRLATEYGMQFAAPNDVLRRALGLAPRETCRYRR